MLRTVRFEASVFASTAAGQGPVRVEVLVDLAEILGTLGLKAVHSRSGTAANRAGTITVRRVAEPVKPKAKRKGKAS